MSMLCVPQSREMQSVLREMRSLFRDPMMRRVMPDGCKEFYSALMIAVAQYYSSSTNKPKHILASIHKMFRRARDMVEKKQTPPVRFLLYFQRDVVQLGCLLSGEFCGRTCPEESATCCICLGTSRGGNTWWKSSSCGHHFHVKCISESLFHDSRCPLCREFVHG